MAVLSARVLARVPGLVHGFLTRSPSTWRAQTVDWQAELAEQGVAVGPVVVARQVHGSRVERIRTPAAVRPEADGLLTSTPGLAVGVVTADCVPVLLVAGRAGVAAAVHSGWRGALAGIAAEAAALMASEAGVGPDAIRAAIGPAIGSCCYEVGPELRAVFERRWGADFVAPMFSMPGPRPHLDLRSLVRRQLEHAGLLADSIEISGPCTKCTLAYASARRDGAAAGRQLSFVGWRAEPSRPTGSPEVAAGRS
jgi:hypothetical protein